MDRPDIVTPSAFSPAAAKAAAPVAKVSPATAQSASTAAPSAAPAPAKVEAPVDSHEVQKLKSDLAWSKRQADLIASRQKAQFQKEREGLSSKLSRLSELEKREAQAKINKSGYLESLYGKDWYDQIIQEKLNGGAPTADVVKSEMDKLREEFEATRKADRDEMTKREAARHEQEMVAARRQAVGEVARFWSEKSDDYPLVEGQGTPAQIASVIAAEIEKRWRESIQRDDDGRIVVDGVAPSVQTIANEWETNLSKPYEKYAEKLKKSAAPVVPPSTSAAQQPRRTLSNDLTGTTPGQRLPPANNEEKRARAEAAYLAARKSAS